MQCIDYPYRNRLIMSFHDAIMKDWIKALWLGMAPILAGQYIFSVLLSHASLMKHRLKKKAKAEKEKDDTFPRTIWQDYYYQYGWTVCPIVGIMICHPL